MFPVAIEFDQRELSAKNICKFSEEVSKTTFNIQGSFFSYITTHNSELNGKKYLLIKLKVR